MSNLDAIAKQLEQNENYRVLRQFVPRDSYAQNTDVNTKILLGAYLDTETTGFNYLEDKIIELGIVLFEFSADGRIFRIVDQYEGFQDPQIAIPEEIIKITGITDDMVKGQKIDLGKIRTMLSNVVVVIAHNSSFDRKFVEQLEPAFIDKAWACSMKDIDWRAEGIESAKLEYIAYRLGFFYSGHRATIDCLAGIHVLSHTLPCTKQLALKVMLDKARTKEYRLWATRSPFDKKDILKKRGYRWNGGENDQPKSWYIDIASDKQDAEIKFLHSDIYGYEAEVQIDTISAFNRYSDRI